MIPAHLSVFFSITLLTASCAQAQAVTDDVVLRETVPAQVIAEAVAAVQAVGDDALKGNYKEVIAKLYPRYRKRAVKQVGSEAELVATFRKMVADLSASGITITKFNAEPALNGFDIPGFDEWLVLVPTTRTIRYIDPATGKVERGLLKDYQIAVRKKSGSEWGIINGSTLEIRELRSLFPSLPATAEELGLPPTGFEKF